MDDRQLLEAAARAAGMMVLPEGEPWPREDIGWFYCMQHGEPAMHKRGNMFTPSWRPLTDDGDALRLAVKLRLVVDGYEGEVVGSHCVESFNPSDIDAARRAIVKVAARAAAALGTGAQEKS